MGAQSAPSLGDSWEPEQEVAWELTGCRRCSPGSKLLRKLRLEKVGLEAHMERAEVRSSVRIYDRLNGLPLGDHSSLKLCNTLTTFTSEESQQSF